MTEPRQNTPMHVSAYLSELAAKFHTELADFNGLVVKFLQEGDQHDWYKTRQALERFHLPYAGVTFLDHVQPTPLEYLWWFQNDPSIPVEIKKIWVHDFKKSQLLTEEERADLMSRLEKMVVELEEGLSLQRQNKVTIVEGTNIESGKILGIYVPWQISHNGNMGYLVGARFGMPGDYYRELFGLDIVRGAMGNFLEADPQVSMDFINGGYEDGIFRLSRVPKLTGSAKTLTKPIGLRDFGEAYLEELK